MTVNSITPSNGCAVVTIAAETAKADISLDDMMMLLQETAGVIKAEILAAG